MMLTTNEPIGGFIALINLEKDILPQKSIKQDVADLIDLLIIRIKSKSVEEVANSLLENVFDLRIDLIEWFDNNDKDLNFYLGILNDHISVNLQLAPFSNLAETISSILLAYEKIVSPIFKTPPKSFDGISEHIQKNRPTYNTLELLSSHPFPQIQYLKKWIDVSLQLETGIILTDLILTGQIQFPKKRIKSELIEFLYSAITKFGAYSIFTGFWIPDSDDISNLTNRMKILSATIELDNNSFYGTSKESFFKMVSN